MKPRSWWIYKGTSNFCSELELDELYVKQVHSKPDGFYDIVANEDTVEGGIKVIEAPNAIALKADLMQALCIGPMSEVEKRIEDVLKKHLGE